MNKKGLLVLALVFGFTLMVSQNAFAGAEDQIIGIIERVLDVIADFLAKVFQSIADAVSSVWGGGEE